MTIKLALMRLFGTVETRRKNRLLRLVLGRYLPSLSDVLVASFQRKYVTHIEQFCGFNFAMGASSGLYVFSNGEVFKYSSNYTYGIAIDGKYLYAAQRSDETISRDSISWVVRFRINENFKLSDPVIVISNLCGGIHQIEHYNQKLYLTDTRLNRLVIVDPDKLNQTGYSLTKKIKYYKLIPGIHLNSVTVTDDFIYLMCHNKTKATGLKSQIYVLKSNLTYSHKIQTPASSAHNIKIDGDTTYINDSGNGKLLRDNVAVFSCDMFLRGMCDLNHRYMLIGGSSITNTRKERTHANGAIFMLDKNDNYKNVNQLLLNGIDVPISGSVNELRTFE